MRQHHDLIGPAHRRKAVGNHQRGALLHQLAERPLDGIFGDSVDAGGGLVEDDQRGIA